MTPCFGSRGRKTSSTKGKEVEIRSKAMGVGLTGFSRRLYLRPGAVLPALEQTVPVTRLPGSRLDGVGADGGVDSLALSF